MGLFAAGWLVVIVVFIAAVAVTNPPPALFEEPATIEALEPELLAPEPESLAPEPAQPEPAPAPAAAPAPEASTAPAAPEATAPGTPAGEPAAPEAPTPAAADESAEPDADIFNELASAGDTAAAGMEDDAVPFEPLDLAALQRERDAARAEVIGQWFGRAWPLLLLCVLLGIVASTFLQGAQIGYVTRAVRNEPAKASLFWSEGARAFRSLLLATLLSLAIGAGLVLVGLLAVLAFAALGNVAPQWLLVVVGLLGGLALLIALIWLGVRLIFWFIAIVVDHAGAVQGLKMSFELTRGRWWPVFGLAVLLGAILYGVSFAFDLLSRLVGLAGGSAGMVLTLLIGLVGLVAGLYVGFASLGAYIRFFEDAKGAARA